MSPLQCSTKLWGVFERPCSSQGLNCRELDSDSDDNKSASVDPLADIPMTNFAEIDYAGNEVQSYHASAHSIYKSLNNARK